MTIMEEQRYYLGLQVAELDTAYSDYSGRLIHTEFGLGETARDLEFLQDYASSIHYGLVEIGGFRRYNELTTDQNRHMYATERANLTSFHVMGGDRYMRLVAQHSTGIHAATDNTNPQALGQEQQEQGEESDMEVDPAVDTPDVDSREHVVNRLRVLIHECLSRHEYSDAAAVQQLVLMTLDRGVPGDCSWTWWRAWIPASEGATIIPGHIPVRSFEDAWKSLKCSWESDRCHRGNEPMSSDLHGNTFTKW